MLLGSRAYKLLTDIQLMLCLLDTGQEKAQLACTPGNLALGVLQSPEL